MDDRRVLSGILRGLRNGLRWQDAPSIHGWHKSLYNRFARWSRLGAFARIFRDLAKLGADGDTLMFDSTHLKARGTAASLRKKGARPRLIGRTKGGLSPKLYMVGDGKGRPLSFFLSPGRMSDARGALVLLGQLPRGKRLLGGKGYDADCLRDEPKAKGLRICIPGRRRLHPGQHSRRLYKERCRIEKAFARLKDWRGIAMRYDPMRPSLPPPNRAHLSRHLLAMVTSLDTRSEH